jgi:uncharacterized protein involved in exopolysaccharide biosynthesis
VKLWVLLLAGALAVAGVGVVRRVAVAPIYRALSSLSAEDPVAAGHVLSSTGFQRQELARLRLRPSTGDPAAPRNRDVRIASLPRPGGVDVVVSAPDAALAGGAANALADAYAELVNAAASADSAARLGQLQAELDREQAALAAIERQLRLRRHDDLSGRQAAARLPDLTASLDRARHSRVGLEVFVERVTDPRVTTVVLRDQTAHLFERRVLELERRRVVVSSRYGKRHPELERLDEAITVARQDRDWVAAQIVGAVEADYRSELLRERLLADEHAVATGLALAGERAASEAEELQRRLDAQRAVVQGLHDFEREMRVLGERTDPPVRVVERAVTGVPVRDPVPYWRIALLLTLGALFARLLASRHRGGGSRSGHRPHHRGMPPADTRRTHRRAA